MLYAKQLRTSIHTANEFNYATPVSVDETAIVITCSLGGNTPETVKATSVAKSLGAHTIAVTHAAGSELTKDADYTVVFDWEGGYSAKQDKMIKVLVLAAEILNQTEGYAAYEKMIDGAEKIYSAIDEAVKSVVPEAKKFAEEYKDAPIVYVTSSGAMQELAWSFSACLMMEMQWIPSATFNDGDFFHGPFEMVEKDVPYLLFMNEGLSYFDVVLSGQDLPRSKPDPMIYHKAAKLLGVKEEECMVLEDSTVGILAAYDAGMRVIALKDERFSFDQSLAYDQIENLKELRKCLSSCE